MLLLFLFVVDVQSAEEDWDGGPSTKAKVW